MCLVLTLRSSAGEDCTVNQRGAPIDRITQTWVRATGRVVAFKDHQWLLGPAGDRQIFSHDWLAGEALRVGGTLVEGGGLIGDFGELAGDGFDPSLRAGPVVDFYEHTSQWRLEVWSQWSPAVWPFAWLLSELFARRLQQLSLPLRPLDAARGIDSRVVTVVSDDGRQLGAAWLRTLRSTGQVVYSGWYGTAHVPRSDRPSIRVVFLCRTGA